MLIAAVGCVISAVCGFYSKGALIISAVSFSVCCVLAIKKKNTQLIITFSLVLIMCLSCFLTINKTEKLNRLSGKRITADICYIDASYRSDNYCRSEFEVIESEDLPRGVHLNLSHKPFFADSGEVIAAEITLYSVDEEYKSSNYSEGIYLTGSIESYERLYSCDWVLFNIARLRDYIKNTLLSNMSYDSAATLTALVTGDRSYFGDPFYGNVKASGVAHVMVVSGMHLSIIVTLMLGITEKIIYNSRLRAVIMVMTVIALFIICGFTKSILRAGITYLIMAAGLLLKRSYSSVNALGFAVTLILIFSPFVIFSVGFQLSVLSTFGILAVAMPICNRIKLKNPLKWFCDSVIMSLSAMLLTLPILIGIFGFVSTVGIITNLLISIPVSYCLSGAVVALIINPLLPFLSSNILLLCNLIVRYINAVINFFGSLPFSTTYIGKWGVLMSVCLIFTVFEIMLACKVREDMIKLKKMNQKILSKRGRGNKWQSFLKKR